MWRNKRTTNSCSQCFGQLSILTYHPYVLFGSTPKQSVWGFILSEPHKMLVCDKWYLAQFTCDSVSFVYTAVWAGQNNCLQLETQFLGVNFYKNKKLMDFTSVRNRGWWKVAHSEGSKTTENVMGQLTAPVTLIVSEDHVHIIIYLPGANSIKKLQV